MSAAAPPLGARCGLSASWSDSRWVPRSTSDRRAAAGSARDAGARAHERRHLAQPGRRVGVRRDDGDEAVGRPAVDGRMEDAGQRSGDADARLGCALHRLLHVERHQAGPAVAQPVDVRGALDEEEAGRPAQHVDHGRVGAHAGRHEAVRGHDAGRDQRLQLVVEHGAGQGAGRVGAPPQRVVDVGPAARQVDGERPRRDAVGERTGDDERRRAALEGGEGGERLVALEHGGEGDLGAGAGAVGLRERRAAGGQRERRAAGEQRLAGRAEVVRQRVQHRGGDGRGHDEVDQRVVDQRPERRLGRARGTAQHEGEPEPGLIPGTDGEARALREAEVAARGREHQHCVLPAAGRHPPRLPRRVRGRGGRCAGLHGGLPVSAPGAPARTR